MKTPRAQRSKNYQSIKAKLRAEASNSNQPPEWWSHAKQLGAEGRMIEAEKTIRDAVDHLGCYASLAEMWKERMIELKTVGDAKGALAAYYRAAFWAFSYASGATSGGEGAALSIERDRILAELVSALGYEPPDDAGFKFAMAAVAE